MAFEALAGKTSGVFIVRLGEDEGTAHAVVVCCKRRIILDVSESHCLDLNASVLQRCAGPAKKVIQMIAVMEIVPILKGQREIK